MSPLFQTYYQEKIKNFISVNRAIKKSPIKISDSFFYYNFKNYNLEATIKVVSANLVE